LSTYGTGENPRGNDRKLEWGTGNCKKNRKNGGSHQHRSKEEAKGKRGQRFTKGEKGKTRVRPDERGQEQGGGMPCKATAFPVGFQWGGTSFRGKINRKE